MSNDPSRPRAPRWPAVRSATLVGRQDELTELAELVQQERLVVITGAGGCGKTRLAIAVAEQSGLRFADGVRWVDLAAINDPSMLPSVLADALDVHEPPPSTSLLDAAIERLRERRALVVIDNCEHLIDACADVVASVVAACPHVAVLATSREGLMVAGERTYEVSPLTVPEPGTETAEQALRASAVELFEIRARQVRPEFAVNDHNAEAVGSICRHLDGIPLAVELAAARIRVLTPAQILAALSDRFRLLTDGYRTAPPRQQTLEASIAWSFGLLAEAERLVLARLAVFAGAFDLEAATAVAAGPEVDRSEVLGLVTALADRSMLQVGEHDGTARYRLLETIRHFARHRLAELDDPGRVRDQHLRYFIDLADRAGVGLSGRDAGSWTERLNADLDDLHAAMAWAVGSDQPERALGIAAPMQRFWLDRGRYSELERSVDAANSVGDASDLDRARGLATATMVSIGAGRYRSAHAVADRAVSAARTTDDDGVLALSLALRSFAGAQSGLGTRSTIRPDVDQASSLAPHLADHATRALVFIYAGLTESYAGRTGDARELFEQAIHTCQRSGIDFHRPTAHALIGVPALLLGDLDLTRTHAHLAIEWHQCVDRPGWGAVALAMLASSNALAGDADATHARLDEATTLLEDRNLAGSVFEMFVHRWAALAGCYSGETVRVSESSWLLRHHGRESGAACYEASGELAAGWLALLELRHDAAIPHLDRCRRLSIEPRYPFTLGRSLMALASLEDDLDRAWELAHEALDVLADADDRIGVAEALEVVADLAARRGRAEHALHLVAASERFHRDTAIVRPPWRSGPAEQRAAARGDLTADEVAACTRAGERLALDECVRYVRRGRGERRRPQAGWQSLTPTERDIVQFVAEGHTNAVIGERMFISVHTVKKHLSSVYTKTGVTGRAELAAASARQGLVSSPVRSDGHMRQDSPNESSRDSSPNESWRDSSPNESSRYSKE